MLPRHTSGSGVTGASVLALHRLLGHSGSPSSSSSPPSKHGRNSARSARSSGSIAAPNPGCQCCLAVILLARRVFFEVCSTVRSLAPWCPAVEEAGSFVHVQFLAEARSGPPQTFWHSRVPHTGITARPAATAHETAAPAQPPPGRPSCVPSSACSAPCAGRLRQ